MGEEQAFSAVQGCNGSHILTAFRKGAPRFDLTIILFQIFSGCFLLLEHMGLDLIDNRLDPCKMLQIQITIQTKIRYADGTNFPCFIKFLYSTIGSVIIAKGLVDQQQVNIICPSFFRDSSMEAFAFSYSALVIHTFVVRKNSSRGRPLSARAAPTPSSLL